MAVTTQPGLHPTWAQPHDWVASSSQGQIFLDSVPHCGVEWSGQGISSVWVGECGDVVTENLAVSKEDLFLPCLGVSQDWHTPYEWNPGFYNLSICSRSSPTSQGGLSPTRRTPGLGRKVCGLIWSLPRVDVHVHLWNLPLPLSPLPGAHVPTLSLFFPPYPNTRVSFLQPGCMGVLLSLSS